MNKGRLLVIGISYIVELVYRMCMLLGFQIREIKPVALVRVDVLGMIILPSRIDALFYYRKRR